ncbi:DUF302 domain-containing protein [Thiomonas bhubaneswarensis]|uniref:Uncharacterized conserved protein, DUF302 family n=1 Tax=Thiomonas bhubaneswarensis TaxID=339866 RepID=A0A0K6HXN6_9BURK|nr:DUF302 domain-containing protein [Thiomonas bhubaneswarensis]CUA95635.1 Uncharacterized conserved protein, DUF302 family [Thiomonas bhubaneswarensis]
MPSIVFSAQPCCTFDNAVTRTTEALKAQGFGIISDIDVSATLKAKLGVDRPPYRILGACAPGYAMKALDFDPHIGALLPCNVVVREDAASKQVVVDFMDPTSVLGLIDKPEVHAIAKEVCGKLMAARDALAKAA